MLGMPSNACSGLVLEPTSRLASIPPKVYVSEEGKVSASPRVVVVAATPPPSPLPRVLPQECFRESKPEHQEALRELDESSQLYPRQPNVPQGNSKKR